MTTPPTSDRTPDDESKGWWVYGRGVPGRAGETMGSLKEKPDPKIRSLRLPRR